METVVSCDPEVGKSVTSAKRQINLRAGLLAERLEQGANALLALAVSLNESEWQARLAHDGRKVGVVIHHVASVYPIEIQLARTVAGGSPVTGVQPSDIDAMNAQHAIELDSVTKSTAIDLLRRNSAAAAAAIRALSDEELDRAATVSLYDDALLTCQFVLEDHAVRHSYHHLAGIRRAVKR
jgi:hypothetical protein